MDFLRKNVFISRQVTRTADGTRLSDLAGIYRQAMLSDDEKMTKILVGDASPVEVKCSFLFEQDKLIDCYRRGWERVGVVLPIV